MDTIFGSLPAVGLIRGRLSFSVQSNRASSRMESDQGHLAQTVSDQVLCSNGSKTLVYKIQRSLKRTETHTDLWTLPLIVSISIVFKSSHGQKMLCTKETPGILKSVAPSKLQKHPNVCNYAGFSIWTCPGFTGTYYLGVVGWWWGMGVVTILISCHWTLKSRAPPGQWERWSATVTAQPCQCHNCSLPYERGRTQNECVCACVDRKGGIVTQVGVLLCRLCQRGARLQAGVAVGTGLTVGGWITGEG